MEFGVRDWMIIIGLLLIVAVLLDGYRRVRNERRGNIRMSLNKQFLNAGGSDEEQTCELPGGGARIVGRKKASAASHSLNTDSWSDSNDPLFSDGPAFGDGQLDLDQTVPMLMESVANESPPLDDPGQQPDGHRSEKKTAPVEQATVTRPEPSRKKTVSQGRTAQGRTSQNNASQGNASQNNASQNNASQGNTSQDPISQNNTSQNNASQNNASQNHIPQEVVVINVVTKDELFKGPDLLHILLACDLRFGNMNIFHRYEKANGSGAVQFSMANSVEPGTFDLDAIDNFTTPGVCFFMSVPGPEQPLKAFECMVETAQCLVSNLNGEMRDESRSAMTNQTLEHCRQRLQEFERRQLAHQI